MKKLEALSNLAVIVVAVIVGAAFIRNGNLFRKPERVQNNAEAEGRLKGTSLGLKGMDTSRTPVAVVLAISTHCQFCEQNAQFYRLLGKLKASGGFALVAAIPQAKGEAESFLQAKDIATDQVVSGPLDAIKVTATPTVLLTDSRGVVQEAWVGSLDVKRQKEVLRKIKEHCPSCAIEVPVTSG
jgi:hypothetical protein